MANHALSVAVWVVTLLACAPVMADQLLFETLLDSLPVDVEGDRNVFSTPLAYRQGFVFTVHVNSGNVGRDGVNLRTEVRKGQRGPDGRWLWEARTVEDRTMRNPWHAQGSIALDRSGHIHVAYNMHNMPWQYSISERPLDISSFRFHGEFVSLSEIETVKFENRTPFAKLGSAAIPGTQITYPMFFTDRNGELYVTYRFALRPARVWRSRAFAGGLAKYDTRRREWQSIGGPVPVTSSDALLGAATEATLHPFAYDPQHTVYLPTIAFDSSNGMHVVWTWREGGAGMETTQPSYAYSSDGIHFSDSAGNVKRLPITRQEADIFTRAGSVNYYHAPKSVAVDPNGDIVVILHPVGGARELWHFSKAQQRWLPPSESPAGASEIVVDRHGKQWAFASGLKIFVRRDAAAQWSEFGVIRSGLCYPKVTYVAEENKFIVHAKSCDGRYASIYSFSGIAENIGCAAPCGDPVRVVPNNNAVLKAAGPSSITNRRSMLSPEAY